MDFDNVKQVEIGSKVLGLIMASSYTYHECTWISTSGIQVVEGSKQQQRYQIRPVSCDEMLGGNCLHTYYTGMYHQKNHVDCFQCTMQPKWHIHTHYAIGEFIHIGLFFLSNFKSRPSPSIVQPIMINHKEWRKGELLGFIIKGIRCGKWMEHQQWWLRKSSLSRAISWITLIGFPLRFVVEVTWKWASAMSQGFQNRLNLEFRMQTTITLH